MNWDETKKTLIVVYKDELLMNQLKKLVETPNNNRPSDIRAWNDSVNIVSWTEKVWMVNKKNGDIQEKILFLSDDIKGTDKLIPVIDIKFDDCGVKFGWAGNQAVLFADPKILAGREDYGAFLKKLSKLSIPSFLKTAKEDIPTHSLERESEDLIENDSGQTVAESLKDVDEIKEEKADKHNKAYGFRAVGKVFLSRADAISKEIGNQLNWKSEEFFRNTWKKSFMKRQMLFYGVINLYEKGLEKFMNL